MKLTGKAYKEFSEWLYKNQVLRGSPDYRFVKKFEGLPESMQWGVYQDFADSLMIDVNVEGYDLQKEFDYVIKQGATSSASTFITRQEARNAAIEKLNEIILNQ